MTQAQKTFDETYISASEICRTLSVTRGAVTSAQRRGLLPQPIKLEQGEAYLCLWLRAEVQTALDAWKLMLSSRKRNHTASVEAHA